MKYKFYSSQTSKKNTAQEQVVDNFINKIGNTKVIDITELCEKEDVQIIPYSKLAEQNLKGRNIFAGFLDVKEGLIYKYEEFEKLSKEKRRKLQPIYIFLDNSRLFHFTVVGSSGFGKTTCLLFNQTISLIKQKDKPNVCIVSAKDDILTLSEIMEDEGYRVHIVDCADSLHSDKFSIFNEIIALADEIILLKNFEGIIKKYGKPKLGEDYFVHGELTEYKNGYYYMLGNDVYPNKKTVDVACEQKIEELLEKIMEHATDLSCHTITSEGIKDIHFPLSSQQVYKGGIIVMVEMYINQENGFKKEHFNLLTLNKIIQIIRKQAEESRFTKELKFLKDKPKAEEILRHFVLDADTTRRNYFSVMQAQSQDLFNIHSYNLTIGEPAEFVNLDDKEKPVALLIRMREDKVSDEHLAGLILESVIYKWSEDRDCSKKTNGKASGRECYFLLDEFANISKLNNFKGKISVARSKKLFYYLYLQSYNQLQSKYEGDSVTILGQTAETFIGTNDMDSKKHFSEHCGNTHINGVVDADISKKSQYNLLNVPTLSTSKLEELNMGDAYIKLNNYVLKTSFVPSFVYEKNGNISLGDIRKCKLFPTKLKTTNDYVYEFKNVNDDDEDESDEDDFF